MRPALHREVVATAGMWRRGPEQAARDRSPSGQV